MQRNELIKKARWWDIFSTTLAVVFGVFGFYCYVFSIFEAYQSGLNLTAILIVLGVLTILAQIESHKYEISLLLTKK